MKRFVLVDPSFDGVAGDKWQYAVAFAKSARANGYKFILLSARRSPSLPEIDGEAIDQRPIFSYAFYEHEAIVTRQRHTRIAQQARQQRARDAKVREGLDEEMKRASEEGDPGRRELLRRRIAMVDREAAQAALLLERECEADAELPEPFNHDDFGVALAQELKKIEPVRGDLLFFHTMTPAMLESFSEASLQMPGRNTWDVDAYCLFHFGAEAPDARTFLDRYHSYSHYGSLVSRLKVGSPFRRLHLLATSEILARECTEIFGLPFSVFHGLSNVAEHFRACGGEAAARAKVVDKSQALQARGVMRLVIRAGDTDQPVAEAVAGAMHRLVQYGIEVEVRVLYHAKSLPRAREILEWFGVTPVTLVDVENNDDYIVELADANLVLLTYPPARYAKRVSAVLHDCAVLGTSCVVPAHTTMATAADYADIWAFQGIGSLPQVILQATRALRHTPQSERDEKVRRARSIYGQDVVTAIVTSTSEPSLEVQRRGPIAALFMPAWGRCGSSYAMEGQVRFLLSKGYFVVQVLVMDKATHRIRALPYLWQLLHENAKLTRGSVQRIAFATAADHAALERSAEYLGATAFDQYLDRVAAASVRDDAAVAALQAAEVAVVNHVFNSRIAKKYVQCRTVLETHDIQSYQMHAWPLRNAATGQVEALDILLQREMHEVSTFDHVVNVAPNEHQVLSLANARSSLVTPYVAFEADELPARMPGSISELVDSWGLSDYYRGVHRFDMLLLGDSHVANRESAEWFIEKVYLPYLQPGGTTLAIAGRLSDALYAKYGTIACVFYIGFVPSVQILRSLCRLSVLPDVRGTGISIKTLETFATGQPFVATSKAVRGFRHLLPTELVTVDDPCEYAESVTRLLHGPAELAKSATLSSSSYALLTSEHKFTRNWEGILDEVLVQP